MDTEDYILKGTKLITNIKKKIIKSRIEVRLLNLQYKKYKTKSITKLKYKYIYMKFSFKNRVFFPKVIVGYKK